MQCVGQEVTPRSRSCVCTLLCYWSPGGDLCNACTEQSQLASLFLHHHHCPQGWVYSEASSSCFRSYNQTKPWSRAARFCEDGGGRLAQPSSNSSIQTVLESINMVATVGQYWLGAREMENLGTGVGGWGAYYWTRDNSTVDNGNWATGYPLLGIVFTLFFKCRSISRSMCLSNAMGILC